MLEQEFLNFVMALSLLFAPLLLLQMILGWKVHSKSY